MSAAPTEHTIPEALPTMRVMRFSTCWRCNQGAMK
jgi:hypothetical protein